MITPDIAIDFEGAIAHLADVEKRHVPFAAMKALNHIGTSFQEVERRHMRDVFTVRQPQWVDRSVKITHFAKKTELFTTIGIQPPGARGGDRADVLGKFEEDREKEPRDGHSIAIPIRARRNKRDIITKGSRPRAFNFRQVGNSIRGDRRTFLIRMEDGTGLILQRRRKSSQARALGYGGRDEALVALYRLVDRVEITPELNFVPNAREVAARRWSPAFLDALEQALRTAR